jgi:hypothetical protein
MERRLYNVKHFNSVLGIYSPASSQFCKIFRDHVWHEKSYRYVRDHDIKNDLILFNIKKNLNPSVYTYFFPGSLGNPLWISRNAYHQFVQFSVKNSWIRQQFLFFVKILYFSMYFDILQKSIERRKYLRHHSIFNLRFRITNAQSSNIWYADINVKEIQLILGRTLTIILCPRCISTVFISTVFDFKYWRTIHSKQLLKISLDICPIIIIIIVWAVHRKICWLYLLI